MHDQHTFLTDSGLCVWVRPMRPDDAPHIINIFEHLSPESRYLRFHEPLTAPDPQFILEQAEALTAQTMRHGHGWLAFADLPDEAAATIGGVRWMQVEPRVAEVALTVRDDLQQQGIGRELLRLCLADARESGIEKLTAVVQGANRAVLRLLSQAGLPVTRDTHAGEIYIEVDLTGDVEKALA